MEEDFGRLTCTCGSENFERVVVARRPQPALVTEFVACVHCRVMFHLPARPVRADPALARDAAHAAAGYRKPSRPPKLIRAEFFLWWHADARTGGRVRSIAHLTREEALARWPDAEPDPTSLEVRYLPPSSKV